MKTLILFVALALTALPAVADDVREYGRATVGYSGESLHVAVSYDYAQVNHGGEWLVFQMGVRTDRAQWLRPRDLEIRTPGGGTIEAPTQSDVNRSRTLRPEVHAAGAFGAEALDRLFGCIPVNELSTSGFAGYTDRAPPEGDVALVVRVHAELVGRSADGAGSRPRGWSPRSRGTAHDVLCSERLSIGAGARVLWTATLAGRCPEQNLCRAMPAVPCPGRAPSGRDNRHHRRVLPRIRCRNRSVEQGCEGRRRRNGPRDQGGSVRGPEDAERSH